MRQYYIVTESDFHDPNPKKRKNHLWIKWANEIGLTPGAKWDALTYMKWCDTYWKHHNPYTTHKGAKQNG